ncbi:MAG: hypothetical protein H8E39_08690 [Alphaproteobacteria bacterium]|nr:hypothetical protein [Alphaproteobacteria bacterium]
MKTAKPSGSVNKTEAPLHWLVRPETIRKLWTGGGVLLTVLVVLELWVHPKGYFGIDATFGFNAWYGFIVCVAMVVGAKGLGIFLKREDTYYERD